MAEVAMRLLYNRAGNHTWNTLQPVNGSTVSIDSITGNITSLWTVETHGLVPGTSRWGSASDGFVKIGLVPWKEDGSLNGKYYKRLEEVVAKAEKRDVVVVVRLFEHTFQTYEQGWNNHWTRTLPAKNRPATPETVHTKGPWNTYQRAHVKRVAQTLNGYDNVTGHVGNELYRYSTAWFQPKVVKWWRKWSDSPIGAGYATGLKPSLGRSQDWLSGMKVDWVAPANGERIEGFKGAYIYDTDHSRPLYSDLPGMAAAWRRGDAVLRMDGFNGTLLRNQESPVADRAWIESVVG
jgi:hypothetical protein